MEAENPPVKPCGISTGVPRGLARLLPQLQIPRLDTANLLIKPRDLGAGALPSLAGLLRQLQVSLPGFPPLDSLEPFREPSIQRRLTCLTLITSNGPRGNPQAEGDDRQRGGHIGDSHDIATKRIRQT